jgi:hypothetical protein
MQYAKRANAFVAGEDVWTVTPNALVRTAPGGATSRLAWSQVTEVRVAYAPTRAKFGRYLISLGARSGDRWTIDNQHFAGIGNFEDRSDRFTPFVLACIERIAALAPQATARIGSSAAAYWIQLIFVSAVFALLVAVILLAPGSLSWLILVKLGLIVAMLPVLIRWIGRARPRRVSLDPEAFRPNLP